MSDTSVWLPFHEVEGYLSGVHVTASEVRDRITSPPLSCGWEVSRGGELQPCDKPAVGLRYDENSGTICEVCKRHAARVMVPLDFIVQVAADT